MSNAPISDHIIGFDRVVNNMVRIWREVNTTSVDSLIRQARAILDDAKNNYVPVGTGALRDSGKVDPPATSGDVTSVAITFGDSKTARYAIAIHEHPSSSSPPSWRGVSVTFNPSGRGPKYLERPFLDSVHEVAPTVAKAVKQS